MDKEAKRKEAPQTIPLTPHLRRDKGFLIKTLAGKSLKVSTKIDLQVLLEGDKEKDQTGVGATVEAKVGAKVEAKVKAENDGKIEAEDDGKIEAEDDGKIEAEDDGKDNTKDEAEAVTEEVCNLTQKVTMR